jgi:hypothetical protein
MVRNLKISIIALSCIALTGCGTLSGLFERPEEPAIIYRTQYRPVIVPDSFFQGCPRYVNPPRSVADASTDSEQEEIELGNWMTINEQRYGQCERTIDDIRNEQDRIAQTIDDLNATLQAVQTQDKNR